MQPPKSRLREWLCLGLLTTYLVVVLLATMWPTPLDRGYGKSIDSFLAILHRNGIPDWFGYNRLEFSANVLMFVPLGLFVSMLLPARLWWLALIICPALSTAIEITQGIALAARFASVWDVAANSIGALIGAIIAVVLRAVVHRRDDLVIARARWELANAHPRHGAASGEVGVWR
jgi:glycopeptide antibiotics resistance protein